VAEAHAVQDAVAIKLGAAIAGYEATAPAVPGQSRNEDEINATETADALWLRTEGIRALIYDTTSTHHLVPFRRGMPQCGVEGEIAFRFQCDLPPRAAPYTHDEIAAFTDAHPTIEVVSSRFASPERNSFLDELADCMSNGGLVYGPGNPEWQRLRLAELRVMLIVNGKTVADQIGGHPTRDPFGIVVALVEMMRRTTGVSAGQLVTTGSFTGLRYFKPSDVCEVRFEGIGAAQLTFLPGSIASVS